MKITTRIIIVGGGFGGLETALSLLHLLGSSASITLIDRTAHHSFIPSIHEVISGRVKSGDIQIAIRNVLAPTNISFLQHTVVAIETKKRLVITNDRELPYDYLVLCSGAENTYYNIKGAERFAHRFRTPEDAERIHADLTALLTDLRNPIHIVIVGGGTEGVEVAGEVIDLIKFKGYEEDLHAERISLSLFQAQEHLLPEFTTEVQNFTEGYLSQLGVALHKGNRLSEVQKNRIILDSGVHYPMSLLIWTGGIQPTQFIQELPLTRDKRGWLEVTDRLHSVDDAHIYALGDVVSIAAHGKSLSIPRLAYHALDQARIVSLNIYYHLSDRGLIGYVPKRKPQLISIGKDMGVFVQGERFFTGSWIVSLKKFIERQHLMTYLTKPGFLHIGSKLPGAELRHIVRLFLPI